VSFLLLFALMAPHWVHIKDAYKIHERWVMTYPDGSVNPLGEYYEVEPGEFGAVCFGSHAVSEKTEQAARDYVQGCEVWE